MKWFKHETDAKDSERIAVLIDGYGFEGYGRFWRICEIIADRMNETHRCHAELPEAEWCQRLKINRPKLRQYLTDIAFIFNINVTSNQHQIKIEYPKLLEKRDNFTRNLQATSKRETSPLILSSSSSTNKVSTPKKGKNSLKKEDIPYQEIMAYLNEKTQKQFKVANSHNSHIKARWAEGFRLIDFKKVIDIKTAEWKGTPDDKYLRPETLFGSRFDSYRNQKPEKSGDLDRAKILAEIKDLEMK